MPGIAQAKDIESYEDYRDYCSPAAYQYGIQSSDCGKFKSIYEERYQQEQNQQQPQRRNTESKKNDDNDKNEDGISGYVGTTLGLFFPNDDYANTGFMDFFSTPGLQRFAGLRGTVAAVSEPVTQMLRIN